MFRTENVFTTARRNVRFYLLICKFSLTNRCKEKEKHHQWNKGPHYSSKGEYSHDFADNTLLVCCFFLTVDTPLNLRKVPTNSKVFLRGLLTMREKQILTSVIEIQKENWG